MILLRLGPWMSPHRLRVWGNLGSRIHPPKTLHFALEDGASSRIHPQKRSISRLKTERAELYKLHTANPKPKAPDSSNDSQTPRRQTPNSDPRLQPPSSKPQTPDSRIKNRSPRPHNPNPREALVDARGFNRKWLDTPGKLLEI